MFVKTDSENNILQYPYTIETFKSEHKNVSFPSDISNKLLEKYNVYPVVASEKPEHDKTTQFTYPAELPTLIEGVWVLEWLIGEKDEAWIANDLKERKTEVRTIRDDLLTKSDWVTIRSIDINTPVEPEWLEYRQALRDIPLQEGYPWNIEWPADPTGATYTE